MVKKETAISGILEKWKSILQAELTSFLPRWLAGCLSSSSALFACVGACVRALCFQHSSLFPLFPCSVHVLWRNLGFFLSGFCSMRLQSVRRLKWSSRSAHEGRCWSRRSMRRRRRRRRIQSALTTVSFFCRGTLLSKSAPSICTRKFCSRRVFFSLSLSPLLSLCWCFLLRLLF